MPPRFVYWTIIAGGLPTAFRAAEREELLPTFKRIQEKHPDAVMKYFARGKLWESAEEAKQAADARRAPGDTTRNRRLTFGKCAHRQTGAISAIATAAVTTKSGPWRTRRKAIGSHNSGTSHVGRTPDRRQPDNVTR